MPFEQRGESLPDDAQVINQTLSNAGNVSLYKVRRSVFQMFERKTKQRRAFSAARCLSTYCATESAVKSPRRAWERPRLYKSLISPVS
jgi:hypothetical protein